MNSTNETFKVYTLAELREKVDRERREQARSKRWGSWRLVPENLTLEHDNTYYIDLEDMTNSAEMLDWIFQVRDKPWATAEVMSDLLRAFYDILDPQANLSSFGAEKTADSVALVKAFVEAGR